jgi:hypothetical protein
MVIVDAPKKSRGVCGEGRGEEVALIIGFADVPVIDTFAPAVRVWTPSTAELMMGSVAVPVSVMFVPAVIV